MFRWTLRYCSGCRLPGPFLSFGGTPPPSRQGAPATSPTRASYYAITDRGRSREHNEDTFLVADLAVAEPVRQSLPGLHEVGERGSLYLVADGMGGAAAGEVASEMAATEIFRYLSDTWGHDGNPSRDRFVHRLREAVELANLKIHNFATDHPEMRGMGTTATVAGVWDQRVFLAQIGDSRGYLVRDGEARQLTRDQSLTQRLVEVGELTEEEAESSERRNIILQALGPDTLVKVDLSSQELQRGDVLIICSDGLSTVVRKDDITRIVGEETELRRACERLVELANERGGPDNITVVSVRFEGENLPTSGAEEPGYHELLTTDERPALQPTAAFPAATPTGTPAVPLRSGAPTGLALKVLGVVIVALGIWLLLLR